MSQIAVAAALAACLLGGVLILPFSNHTSQVAGTYVDILADAHGDEAAGIPGGFRLDLLDTDQR